MAAVISAGGVGDEKGESGREWFTFQYKPSQINSNTHILILRTA
jgi:hypothetical protein